MLVHLRRSQMLGLSVLASTLLVCQLAQGDPGSWKGEQTIKPFDYRGVRIDAGRLREQIDLVREEYLRLDNDSLLKGFRARAGRPAPGRELGGWYRRDRFHVFGQIISGLTRLYAATGDERCQRKVNRLIREWRACIAPDGFFFYSNSPNAPHYIYDKMVGGLVDAYLYCGNREALEALEQITQWAERHLGRRRLYAYTTVEGETEWYTLSENLYRAYLATGCRRYWKFAELWEYNTGTCLPVVPTFSATAAAAGELSATMPTAT